MAGKHKHIKRIRAEISGRVQGVGFRPTVCRYARALSLSGFVRNTPAGVLLEVQGPPEAVATFLQRLQSEPPRQAVMESIRVDTIPAVAEAPEFEITASARSGDLRAGMPPDLATCAECRAELFDPANRRHRYPFINCIHCGPRFTLIRELPYDRERTSMATFTLCPECRKEYRDPADRRFDAQPNACPVCGPRVTLINSQGEDPQYKVEGQRSQVESQISSTQHPTPRNAGQALNPAKRGASTQEPIQEAVRVLKTGGILAVKGLGGYHLACDAASDKAVARLRARKRRPHKSLAVMFTSIEELRRHCDVNEHEAETLGSCAAPIVILRRKAESNLSRLLSPDTEDLGAFLPYSPLHHLLLAGISPLVMTSGNLAEEPIARDEDQLARILGTIADAALTHNRPILRRCDDSVIQQVNGERLILRRSRGLVPDPLSLPLEGPPVLACGADLKNTIGLTRGNEVFLSQHIGDLEDYRAFRFFRETIADLTGLLNVQPAVIAHDLHPDYHSTRYALSPEAPAGRRVGVQHHHAHIAACMAEHQLADPVIGVALDGTGYGPDGTIWGGEFLVADFKGYRRAGHFKPYRMPGGEEAIRQPARMAFSILLAENLADAADLLPALDAPLRTALSAMIEQALHAPLTSSAGRLFDAVAALLGVGDAISYEARGAIRLQTLADRTLSDAYPFEIYPDPVARHGVARLPKADPLVAESSSDFQDHRTPCGATTKKTILPMTETLPDCLTLSFGPSIRALVAELRNRADRAGIAGKFHTTVARAVVEMCQKIRAQTPLNRVALSGGVFQNALLLARVTKGLLREGFQVYSHHAVPPNDGGIALGQAAVALRKLKM